jgi:hypothetical protein
MKYRFQILYRNKFMKKASESMRSIGFDDTEIGYKEVLTLTTKEEKSISEVKEHIRKCFEECEMELMHIEGGIVV